MKYENRHYWYKQQGGRTLAKYFAEDGHDARLGFRGAKKSTDRDLNAGAGTIIHQTIQVSKYGKQL